MVPQLNISRSRRKGQQIIFGDFYSLISRRFSFFDAFARATGNTRDIICEAARSRGDARLPRIILGIMYDLIYKYAGESCPL